MELKSKVLLLLEEGLDALIESHKSNIVEIKNLPASNYETRRHVNQLLKKPQTIEDFRQRDIEKEKKRIKETLELKEKLCLSNNYLLVVSNRIQLNRKIDITAHFVKITKEKRV